MTHKKILPFLIIGIMMLLVQGCVDVPTKGVDLPDARDLVRILNATSGLDTQVVLISKDSTSLATGVADSSAFARTFIYHTNTIDFNGNDVVVYIDNEQKTSLASQTSTDYLNIKAGLRTLGLNIVSSVIDSMTITDTITYKKGKFSREFGKDTVLDIVAVPFNQTIQYYQGPKSLSVDRKGTLYLHPKTSAGNYATFFIERYKFENKSRTDTAVVRLMNTDTASYSLSLKSNASASLTPVIAFIAASGYFPVKIQSDDSLFLKKGSTFVDTLAVGTAFQARKVYTLVTYPTANGTKLKKFTDD